VPTKILVADDSATMRRVLEMTFAGEDARVLAVDSGDAALSKTAELMPDIVFADASMPGVDGYEVARRIKTNPQLAKVAVIVMASQHTPYDDGRGRAAGVDDHIPKPFDTQSVIDRVAQVLARPRAQATSGGAEAPKGPPPAPRPAAAGAAAPPPPRAGVGNATRMGIGAPVAAPPARPQPIPAAAAAVAAPQPMRSAAPAQVAAAAPAPAPAAVRAAPAPAPAPAAPAPAPAAAPSPVAAPIDGAVGGMAQKLGQLGLSREQVEGVLALSREVVEQVVWEVVPVLAEQIIKEELKRLTAD
jgi:CheY-like chemotaxis protein